MGLYSRKIDDQCLDFFHTLYILEAACGPRSQGMFCLFLLKQSFRQGPSHSTLIHKLVVDLNLNPYLIWWIRNYLTGRQQAVVLDGVESCVLPVVSGVPQGSVLYRSLALPHLHRQSFTRNHVLAS